MWETMYHSNGVGLAAPQINKPIRLFVIDTVQIVEGFDEEDRKLYPNEKPTKQTFINAHIVDEAGAPWSYNEGCLSLPKLREDVKRNEEVTINFLDENFEEHTETYNGITARVILHEYDHIDGVLFIDHLPAIKRRLIKKKLHDISSGKTRLDYKMLYPKT